jgi:P-type Ca2+ transporter type 2C
MSMMDSKKRGAAWHMLSPEALCAELATDPASGLTDEEARRRLLAHGPNELPAAAPISPLAVFLRQFAGMIVWVLVGAAVVSVLLQEWIDAAAIAAIVVLNALLGFVQEYKAERSLAALKTLSVPTARVVRAGADRGIPARDLVPGDLILIGAGDHVPADARLLYASALRTQEAALTGESTPVDKARDTTYGAGVSLADRRNMVFLGTDVTAGKGRAVVVATGLHTELGHIASLMQEAGTESTPLQRRLEQFGHVLLYLSLGIVTLVFALGLLRGEPLGNMFLTAVSLAVAAIPEGLPAIVTIALALGVMRMVKRHALIRRLPAVETLGSTTVICTDKTGTLTKNEMTVTRLYRDGDRYDVTGEGYDPTGDVHDVGCHAAASVMSLDDLLRAGVLCNDARLLRNGGGWAILGDPTEGALLVAAAKRQLWKDRLESEQPLLGEVPFDASRKMMTVVRQTAGTAVAYVKGAPDVLLRRCTHHLSVDGRMEPLDEETRRAIVAANEACARGALRVLGLAQKPLKEPPFDFRSDDLEVGLTWLGLAAMKDPLRPEAKQAALACRQAGIRIVMITGDHKDTALAIAGELGIVNGHDALSGVELDRLSDAALAQCVERIAVYARVSAEHKLRVVKAWKARGAIVAMTGDGVNDAPAVKEADIGIAMGLTGTDVTKEASDMVVTDDNFASIAAAVEEGRGIYDNIRKSIHYLLSCNLSEILLMLLAALLALPLPLLPVQILWINLVTDGLPALALAADPKAPDLMQRPPRPAQQRLLTGRRLQTLLVQGIWIALATLLMFVYALFGLEENVDRARTMTFTGLVLAQLFHAFNCRSDRQSIVTVGFWTNKPLVLAVGVSILLQAIIILTPWARPIFGVTPLDPVHWAIVGGLGVTPLLAMELWKRYAKSGDDRSRR